MIVDISNLPNPGVAMPTARYAELIAIESRRAEECVAFQLLRTQRDELEKKVELLTAERDGARAERNHAQAQLAALKASNARLAKVFE